MPKYFVISWPETEESKRFERERKAMREIGKKEPEIMDKINRALAVELTANLRKDGLL